MIVRRGRWTRAWLGGGGRIPPLAQRFSVGSAGAHGVEPGANAGSSERDTECTVMMGRPPAVAEVTVVWIFGKELVRVTTQSRGTLTATWRIGGQVTESGPDP